MTSACPSCGFALVSADADAVPCPECGMDADGRAALAHRSARAVRWAGAALGTVASIELLREAHRLAVRGILALTTNEDTRAAINGELAAFDRARVWITMAQLAVVLAAGIVAWRAGSLRRSPRGGLAWALAGVAIALPAAELVAMAIAVAAPDAAKSIASTQLLMPIWLLASMPWITNLASAPAVGWIACAPPVRRPRALGASLWLSVLLLLLGTAIVAPNAYFIGPVPGRAELVALHQLATWSTALTALFALRGWPHVHEPLPEHRPGDVVTLRHAMHMGGTVLGWALAMIGVLVWIVARSRPLDLTSVSNVLDVIPTWMVARDVLAMLLVAAWVIPAFLVPDPRAAKTWKLAALISGAAAVLFAGR